MSLRERLAHRACGARCGLRALAPRPAQVVVVLSHCGWNGATEIMAAAKPCVAVPFVGDQVDTAAHMKKVGLGEVIAESKITAQLVTRATKLVMENASYADAATSLRQKLLECGGARQMADVIEDCARKKDHRKNDR